MHQVLEVPIISPEAGDAPRTSSLERTRARDHPAVKTGTSERAVLVHCARRHNEVSERPDGDRGLL